LEYGNEFWNGPLSGQETALGHAQWPNQNQDFTLSANYYGMKTAQNCDAWKAAWGGDASRVVCVMGNQTGNYGVVDTALRCPYWSGAPCSAHGITAIADAAYFGPGYGAGYEIPPSWLSDPDGGMSKLCAAFTTDGLDPNPYLNGKSYINAMLSSLASDYANLSANEPGMTMVGYEGSPALQTVSPATNGPLYLNFTKNSSCMTTVYQTFLTQMQAQGYLQLLNHFSDANYQSMQNVQYGLWGGLDHIWDNTSPKYAALVNFISGNTVSPTTPVISPSSSFLSFSGTVGTNPANQTLTISNTGVGTLAWTATKTQTWLSLTPTTGGNGGSITLSINTTGLAAGTFNDTITITDPNASNSPQTVTVNLTLTSGVAGTPVITSQPQNTTVAVGQSAAFNVTATGGSSSTGGAAIAFAPTSLSFGSVAVGSQAATQAIVVSNSGSAALTITNISASGDYTQTNNCTTVAAGGSCAIGVTFAPSTTGTRSGTITVTDNVSGSPQSIGLSGTGTSSSGGGGASGVVFNTSNYAPYLTFPATNVGSQSTSLRANWYNGSTQGVIATGFNLIENGVTYTGNSNSVASSPDFSVSFLDAALNGPGFVYQSYSGFFVDVTFNPSSTSPGTKTATFQVVSNASDSPTVLTLTGTVTGATPSIAFGSSALSPNAIVSAQDQSGLTYQWQTQSNGQWVNDTTDTGNTSASLTINSAQASQSGTSYQVIVTNSAGSVTSSPAVLTVTSGGIGPTITAQPQSATVQAGQSATFNVTATGSPSPTYQWQTQSNGQWVNDTTDTGNTTASLTINSAQASQSGNSYQVIVTNSGGSVTSSAAILTVTSGNGGCNPVTFVAGSVSPTTVAASGAYTMSCDYGSGGVSNSIRPLPGSGTCSVFLGFTGTAAQFSCTAGSTPGTFANSCSVITNSQYNLCAQTNSIGSLTIPGTQTPVINSAGSATGIVGQPFLYSITATNTPVSYGVSGALPTGLMLNAQTGSISGTPTTAGTTPVTISATNSGGTGTASLSIVIQPSNSPPTVVNAASANPNPVIGTTAALSVLGSDPSGAESDLTYTWSVTGTPPAGVLFSANGTNAAKNTTVTFSQAGSYSFQVVLQNPAGLTATSNMTVQVNQTLSKINVAPPVASVEVGATQTFSASGLDQFNQAMASAPTFTWMVSGGGSINSSGLFTAGTTKASVGGPFTVTAASGSQTGTASVTVTGNNNPPTVVNAASANPNPVSGTTAALSVLGSDPSGTESDLTYTWSVTGTPPAGVLFSANGTNAAKYTTVTFSQAGSYSFQVVMQNPEGLTATSNVTVQVNQTLSKINVAPPVASVSVNATQTFSASGLDQFNQAMLVAPTFTWTVGGGSINSSGLFTAGGTAGGPFTVTAASGGQTGTASVTVTGNGNPPTVVNAASANPSTVSGTTAALSVLGSDPSGTESDLTYTWSLTGDPPAGVLFSANGSNAAQNTTVTFSQAGSYSFQVVMQNPAGLTATSNVTVQVNQTLSKINVAPPVASVAVNATQTFSASGLDQFNQAMAIAPTFTWTVGGGSINSSGLFTAGGTAGGPFTVTAASGGKSGTANVTVTGSGNPPTVVNAASANPSTVSGTTAALSVLGSDPSGTESDLTYTWSVTGTPPAGVLFSANATNAAKNTTVTFSQAGSYSFQVVLQNPAGLTATSNVTVQVNQTLSKINVAPLVASVGVNATQTFSASGLDQFNQAMAIAPTFAWTVSGGGSINSAGLFTAGTGAGGPFTVTAASGSKSGTANVTVTGSGNPPTVAVPASVNPSPVTGTMAGLSVLGDDSAGEANLTYTWIVPYGLNVSANGTNAAKNITVTFSQAGNYTLAVVIRDAGGQTTSSSVNVVVLQTLTTLSVNPPAAVVAEGATQAFAAQALDQFKQPMIGAAPAFVWSVSGGGSINSLGLFTAASPAVAGSYTVTASGGGVGVLGTAQVTVTANGGTTSLPTPVLDLPSEMALNADLSFTYDSSVPNVEFIWTITPITTGSQSEGSFGASPTTASGVLSSQTPAPSLSLAQWSLTPGLYTISVKASNGTTTSAAASQNVNLVNAATNGSTVRVYPNPWRKDKHSGHPVTFDQMTSGSDVKIFSVSGHKVKELNGSSGSVTWDLTDDSGDQVASGIYIYLIKDSQGNKSEGKLAVIR
jgi:hypothetical protein